VRRQPPRQLLGAEPVDEEWQVGAVLLDGAEGQEDDGARIAREAPGFGPGELGEPDQDRRKSRRVAS
jgi:hypothetical protein